jgi:hypothetical protein
MAAHTLVHEERRRRTVMPARFELGWPQFWLLAGILGGILAVVVLVLFAYLSAV